jgi:hypothetical protein
MLQSAAVDCQRQVLAGSQNPQAPPIPTGGHP